MDISVVIPLYDEEQSISELCDALWNSLIPLKKSFEVIFVDDGSSDRSLMYLKKEFKSREELKYLSLQRNYGKAIALREGFKASSGDAVITMDADLQDDPSEISTLLGFIEKGYHMVNGYKETRRDPLEKTLPSKLFNLVVRTMTGIKLKDFNSGFKAYEGGCVRSLELYGELHRYIPVLLHNKGYQKIVEVSVVHRERKHGRSKYGIERYFKGLLDFLTVILITKFDRRPLHLFGGTGLIIMLIGFSILSYLVVLWFLDLGPIGSRPLFFLGICFLAGFQSITVGLLAEMLSRISPEQNEVLVKARSCRPSHN